MRCDAMDVRGAAALLLLLVACICMGVAQPQGGNHLTSKSWLQSVSLNRSIVKSGFHRELVIDVRLGDGAHPDCCIMIQEQLPRGLYVDPYELASLREHNAKIFVQKRIDIEAPEYLSTAHMVIIYLNPNTSNPGYFTGLVPVHVRYHRPTDVEETNTLVILTNPHLMIHCPRGWRNLNTAGSCRAEEACIDCDCCNITGYHFVLHSTFERCMEIWPV
ncbi:phosphatidylinositol-glycan biosynthesis class X protein isoform X2 [Rhinoraja longicauda]